MGGRHDAAPSCSGVFFFASSTLTEQFGGVSSNRLAQATDSSYNAVTWRSVLLVTGTGSGSHVQLQMFGVPLSMALLIFPSSRSTAALQRFAGQVSGLSGLGIEDGRNPAETAARWLLVDAFELKRLTVARAHDEEENRGENTHGRHRLVVAEMARRPVWKTR